MKADRICAHCNKRTATITSDIRKQAFCRPCFLDITESRLRAALRLWNLSGEKEIIYVDDGSAAAAATGYVIKSAFRNSRKKITSIKKRGESALLPFSLEETCAYGIEALFKNRKFTLPLSATMMVPMPELEKFCKLKGLKFKKRAVKTNRFLERLQKEYPQTYFSFIQTLIKNDAKPR